jgi:hypothetical protein
VLENPHDHRPPVSSAYSLRPWRATAASALRTPTGARTIALPAE